MKPRKIASEIMWTLFKHLFFYEKYFFCPMGEKPEIMCHKPARCRKRVKFCSFYLQQPPLLAFAELWLTQVCEEFFQPVQKIYYNHNTVYNTFIAKWGWENNGTASYFWSGAMPTSTKPWNPTILGQGPMVTPKQVSWLAPKGFAIWSGSTLSQFEKKTLPRVRNHRVEDFFERFSQKVGQICGQL